MKVIDSEAAKIKTEEFPKYVQNLLSRKIEISIPENRLKAVLDETSHFPTLKSKIIKSLAMRAITFKKASLQKLDNDIVNEFKATDESINKTITTLGEIHSDYYDFTGITIINKNELEKLKAVIIKYDKEIKKTANGIINKTLRANCVKVLTANRNFSFQKKGSVASALYDSVFEQMTSMITSVSHIVYCEKGIKESISADILSDSEVSKALGLGKEVKKIVLEIKEHAEEAKEKYPRHKKKFEKLINTIDLKTSGILFKELGSKTKIVKYSKSNAKHFSNAKSYLKTIVDFLNKFLDSISNPDISEENRKSEIDKLKTKIKSAIDSIDKCLDKVNDSADRSSEDISTLAYNVNVVVDRMNSFMNDPIVVELNNLIMRSQISDFVYFVLSNMPRIMTALGTLSALVV